MSAVSIKALQSSTHILIMLSFLRLAGLSVCVLPALCFPATSSKVAGAWFAGWHSTKGFALSNVTWSKYTHLTYAFAETTADVHSLDTSGSNPKLIPKFVSEAHNHGVKALVSIGGWTGSRYYSSNVANPSQRTAFVRTVIKFAKKYKLDGIDFDWEYPNNLGIGCNAISPRDTANFLNFLQELRADPFGKTLILTAATGIAPFMDADGKPSSNISPFAKVLDFIAIMNYDIWGSWSPTVGPNSPLDDSCASPANRVGSATSAIAKWTKAGFPSSQLLLGVPGYGHSYRVHESKAYPLTSYPSFDASSPPVGDSWDDAPGVDVCGNVQAQGGIVNFWGLIEKGFLNDDGSVKDGISSAYDGCSQTPYVYNSKTKVMVAYDNSQSFAAKGRFIKKQGLAGFFMWEAGGDFNNILIDSIRHTSGVH